MFKSKLTAFVLGVLFFVSILLIASDKPQDTIILSKSNLVVLSGEIDGDTVGQLVMNARKLDSRFTKRPIYMFLNTPGGEIQTGMEMLESLRGFDRPVNTITLFSASMGFQVVEGLGERLILKNGVLMSHRASGEFKGSFGGQRPSQLDQRYNLWLTRMDEFDKQVVKRTNGKQTLASYQKAYADELWLTGTQAVEGGYADRVVTVKCDSSLAGTTTHSVTFLGFLISYELDNCPVNTSPMNVRISSPDDPKNSISLEKKEEVKAKFVQQYTLRHRMVSPPSL